MNKVNVLVKYAPLKVEKIAFQCPRCKNWFYAKDVCDTPMNTSCDIEELLSTENQAQPTDCPYPPEINFDCPKCGYNTRKEIFFGYDVAETNVFPKILEKKTVWK